MENLTLAAPYDTVPRCGGSNVGFGVWTGDAEMDGIGLDDAMVRTLFYERAAPPRPPRVWQDRKDAAFTIA